MQFCGLVCSATRFRFMGAFSRATMVSISFMCDLHDPDHGFDTVHHIGGYGSAFGYFRLFLYRYISNRLTSFCLAAV